MYILKQFLSLLYICTNTHAFCTDIFLIIHLHTFSFLTHTYIHLPKHFNLQKTIFFQHSLTYIFFFLFLLMLTFIRVLLSLNEVTTIYKTFTLDNFFLSENFAKLYEICLLLEIFFLSLEIFF